VSRTVVHLLRHGKVHNPSGLLYGRLPGYHLAASGRAMAEGIAEHLADTDIAYVAASSLVRAQETASPLAAAKGLSVVTDDRVIEAGNEFEGLKVAVGDGVLRQPRYWVKLRNPFLPSWGEPYLEIAHRMLGAIYSAVAAADGHEALIVSHQLPIVTVRRYLEGLRLWHNPTNRECSVASLTALTFDDGVFAGLKYSEPVAHIAAVDDAGLAQPTGRSDGPDRGIAP
jgi:broad specificity phosphatase PhoE